MHKSEMIAPTYYMKHMANLMKNFFKNIWIGVKHAYILPSLPISVNNFHNYPLTRIFRVLGGLSILLVLSGYDLARQSFLLFSP